MLETLDKNKADANIHNLTLDTGESIVVDLSKTHLLENDRTELKKELQAKKLSEMIEKMWNGDAVNYTEGRPVLHYLLRDKRMIEGKDIDNASEVIKKAQSQIRAELKKVENFCNEFKSLRGVTGKAIKNIVNIGIGGSDLGPRMATRALREYAQDGLNVFFISNVDGNAALSVFKDIEPDETLFIVVSKTFTTAETISNFKLCLSLFKDKVGKKDLTDKDICEKHFVAVSSNLKETQEYGIERVFKMWDFVGGRYSLWSPVGLSIALYIGFSNYCDILKGAFIADEEFYEHRGRSIASEMAIVDVYYARHGYSNKCVASYDENLSELYRYLQQAEMESNGKPGSPQLIIWGGTGTDVQHSFFQQLHQGDQKTLTEFLIPSTFFYKQKFPLSNTSRQLLEDHHKVLISNGIAQSRALLIGKKSEKKETDFPGNRPSTTILYTKMSPAVLGALLALYEHKIFVCGILYDINSFDQFGVQLGKEIAKEIYERICNENSEGDPSTKNILMEVYRMMK